jgi:aerobic-type carbon monoxide dehydrogenase small subunit (CoxS/CutS family)
MKKSIKFTLNDKSVKLKIEPDRSLLWVLRGDLNLTGTKYGGGEGVCGAGTVLVDGAAERACLMEISDVADKKLTTIEGLAKGDKLHPMQQAFIEKDAMQCGYCTPGMILSAVSLLAEEPDADKADIIAGLDDNLCRCGAHKRILEAVQSVIENKQD